MAMAKDKDTGNYLWATEMWHKKLLDYETKPGVVARLISRENRKARKHTNHSNSMPEDERK